MSLSETPDAKVIYSLRFTRIPSAPLHVEI